MVSILIFSLLHCSSHAQKAESFLELVAKASEQDGDHSRKMALAKAAKKAGEQAGDACKMRELVKEAANIQDPKQREVARHALALVNEKWSTQMKLMELGVADEPSKFDGKKHPGIDQPHSNNTQWGGSGITGVYPGSRERIPFTDVIKLWRRDSETLIKYDDVRGTPPSFITGKRNFKRQDYVDVFLNRPIVTKDPDAYCGTTPSRAALIRSAACKHGIAPHVLAGFLLAEQQDQTINEDRVDYQAGAGLGGAGKNTSVGIAQIQMKNGMAKNADIFSDLLPSYIRGSNRVRVASYLASDEYAIFAAARFIRNLANEGAKKMESGGLPNTRARFPNATPAVLRGDRWNEDAVMILGSEYTSTPWDDDLHQTWGRLIVNMSELATKTESDLNNIKIPCRKDSSDLNSRGVFQSAPPTPSSSGSVR